MLLFSCEKDLKAYYRNFFILSSEKDALLLEENKQIRLNNHEVLYTQLLNENLSTYLNQPTNPLVKHITEDDYHSYYLYCLMSILYTIEYVFSRRNNILINLNDAALLEAYPWSYKKNDFLPHFSLIDINSDIAKKLLLIKNRAVTTNNENNIMNKMRNIFLKFPFILSAVDLYISDSKNSVITGPLKNTCDLKQKLKSSSNLYLSKFDLDFLLFICPSLHDYRKWKSILSWYNPDKATFTDVKKYFKFLKNLILKYPYVSSNKDLVNMFRLDNLFKINFSSHITANILEFSNNISMCSATEKDRLLSEFSDVILEYMNLYQYYSPGKDSTVLMNSQQTKAISLNVLKHSYIPTTLDNLLKKNIAVTTTHIQDMNELLLKTAQQFMCYLFHNEKDIKKLSETLVQIFGQASSIFSFTGIQYFTLPTAYEAVGFDDIQSLLEQNQHAHSLNNHPDLKGIFENKHRIKSILKIDYFYRYNTLLFTDTPMITGIIKKPQLIEKTYTNLFASYFKNYDI